MKIIFHQALSITALLSRVLLWCNWTVYFSRSSVLSPLHFYHLIFEHADRSARWILVQGPHRHGDRGQVYCGSWWWYHRDSWPEETSLDQTDPNTAKTQRQEWNPVWPYRMYIHPKNCLCLLHQEKSNGTQVVQDNTRTHVSVNIRYKYSEHRYNT